MLGGSSLVGWFEGVLSEDYRKIEAAFESLKAKGLVLWADVWIVADTGEPNAWGEKVVTKKRIRRVAFVKAPVYDPESKMPIGKYQGMDLILQATKKSLLDRGISLEGRVADEVHIQVGEEIFDVKAIVPLLNWFMVELRCSKSVKTSEEVRSGIP